MVALVETADRILAFFESAAWQADIPSLNFVPVDMKIAEQHGASRVPLFRVLHDIHNGAILGTAGKILLDISGVILLLLCLSGVYDWWCRR